MKYSIFLFLFLYFTVLPIPKSNNLVHVLHRTELGKKYNPESALPICKIKIMQSLDGDYRWSVPITDNAQYEYDHRAPLGYLRVTARYLKDTFPQFNQIVYVSPHEEAYLFYHRDTHSDFYVFCDVYLCNSIRMWDETARRKFLEAAIASGGWSVPRDLVEDHMAIGGLRKDLECVTLMPQKTRFAFYELVRKEYAHCEFCIDKQSTQ